MASAVEQVEANGTCANSSDDTECLLDLDPTGEYTCTKEEDEIPLRKDPDGMDTFASDFSTKSWREDLTLTVEGKKLYVTSCFLALESPVFASMFDDKFTEDGPREINLMGKSHSDVAEFLRCIYPTIKKPVTFENIYVVLPLIDEYRVKSLDEKCEKVLVSMLDEDKTPGNICKIANQASSYKLMNLREQCVKLVVNIDLEDLKEAEVELPLPLDIKVEILERKVDLVSDTNATLSKSLKESQFQCQGLENLTKELEEVIKALWSNDGGSLLLDDNKIGILKLKIEKAKTFKRTVSLPVDINKIKWKIIAYADDFEWDFSAGKRKTSLCITLNAAVISKTKDWSCKVQANMRILRRNKSLKHLWKTQSGTVKSSGPEIRFNNIVEVDQLWSNEFLLNNEVAVEVFLLVDDLYVVV